MATFCYFLLCNGLAATGLAVCLCYALKRFRVLNRPALKHLLWLLVLLRLVAPPMLPVDLEPTRAWVVNRLQRQSEQQFQVFNKTMSSSREVLHAMLQASMSNQLLPLPSVLPAADTVSVTRVAPEATLIKVGLSNARVVSRHADGLAKSVFFPVWLIGAVVCMATQVYAAVRFSRGVRREAYASRIWQRRTERVAKRMGLKKCPKLLLVRAKISPMLWGFGGYTCILFPEKLLEGLTIRAQDTLIAHELAHYRRGDQWVRLIELFAMSLFWWNPIFWLARNQIEHAEENCCDAWAVRQANGCPRTYADALLATVDFLSVGYVPPVASAVAKVEFLRERLQAIMCERLVQGRSLLPESYPGILGLAVIILVPTPVFMSANVSTPASNKVMRQQAGDRELSDYVRPPLLPVLPDDAVSSVGPDAPGSWDGVELILDQSNHATLTNGLHSLDLGVGRVSCADFSEDGRVVAVGFNDGFVQLIECGGLTTVSELRFGCSKVDSVSITADAAKLAVGTRDGEFHLVDLRKDQHSPRFVRRFRGQRVSSVSFARNGQSVAIVWQRRTRNRIEFVQLRDLSVDSSDWVDSRFAVAFDDVVSRTSPPHWRFATPEGDVFVWEKTLQRTPELDLSDAQLRSHRLPCRP